MHYSRGTKDYGGGRYNCIAITYYRVLPMVDAMVALGYLETREHNRPIYSGRRQVIVGRQSGIKASGKMVDFFTSEMNLAISNHREVIILRGKDEDGKAVDVEYLDRAKLKKYKQKYKNRDDLILEPTYVAWARGRLHKLNKFLAAAEIELPEWAVEEANIENTADKKTLVDKERTWLARIFSGNFKSGGRFYYGFWQLVPSRLRKHLTINGEGVVEVDYKCMAPRLLYAKYMLDYIEDAYDLTMYGYDGEWRKVIKMVLNAMMCGESYKSVMIGATVSANKILIKAGKEKIRRTDIAAIMDALADKHRVVADSFYTGVGMELQYQDSVMADMILTRLMKEGVVCLPIHDSFIVQERHRDGLIEAMLWAYEDKTKFKGMVGVK